MSSNHIIVLESPAALSVDKKRLKIATKGDYVFFAFNDIAVLYLDNRAIRISNSVLKDCGEHNVTVLTSNDKHIPTAMSLPFAYNNRQAKRAMQQALHCTDEILGLWWQRIVEARIATEILNLHACGIMNTSKLADYKTQVMPGDSTMVEAKAARVYWNKLCGHGFKRIQQGAQDYKNVCLNYGYAIIRAAMARVCAGYGLITSFGIGHCRQDNPFNLVEDLMEPFRYLAEQQVFENPDGEFNASTRLKTMAMFEKSVIIQNKEYRVISAMEKVVQSYCQALEDHNKPLALPGLLGEHSSVEEEPSVQVL